MMSTTSASGRYTASSTGMTKSSVWPLHVVGSAPEGAPPVRGAAWFIEPHSNGDAGCRLLREPVGFDDTVWTGEPPPDDALAAAAGIDLNALAPPDNLTSLLAGRKAGVIHPPCPPTTAWIGNCGLEPANPDDLLPVIEMRLIKDEHELVAMRRAAEAGVQAHLAAMKAAVPGRREADAVAALTAVLAAHDCREAFTPIVSIRGEILHSEVYPNALERGNLLLADVGAEEPGGYASDMTRTCPVGGSFTDIQRHLYDTVLRSERAAIAACLPGRRYRDIHDLAARVICKGLVEAELLYGDPAELAARAAHTLFFPHGVGHLIGLDVHDMEDFGDLAAYAPGRTRRKEFGSKFLRLDRDLAPGMTVTIEPGLYLVPAIWQNDELVAPFVDVVNRRAVDALLASAFGGIRLEDVVHVLGPGAAAPEVLSSKLPTDADDITAIVANA